MLLESTDMSVREIAERLAFNTVNYFIQSFREAAGCTPAQYRKQHKSVYARLMNMRCFTTEPIIGNLPSSPRARSYTTGIGTATCRSTSMPCGRNCCSVPRARRAGTKQPTGKSRLLRFLNSRLLLCFIFLRGSVRPTTRGGKLSLYKPPCPRSARRRTYRRVPFHSR